MLEIKLLGPSDEDLLSNAAADVFDHPVVPSSAAEFLRDPRHRLVAALDGNTVMGFVSGVIYLHPDKPAPELWINEIGVAPTYQRRGIGNALLQAILAEAKRSGCTEAWVLTERENIPAIALYSAAGGMESSPDPVMFTFNL